MVQKKTEKWRKNMPNLRDMFKNYVIDSEQDIPTEYREEIEQKLNTEPKDLQFEATKLTPGVNGTVLSKNIEIKESFSDSSVYYFGHGTTGDKTVLDSILSNGLKVVNSKKY